ncbi:MAG: hypothetical protein ACLFWD_06570 [Anaerolineales bacterium]
MNPRTIVACSGGSLGRALEGADGRWQVEEKLEHVKVLSLAQNPNALYAGTDKDGLWVSVDRGDSWRQLGLKGEIIKSLAVSPHDPKILYAGTKPARMHKSQDGGESWHELDGFRRIPNRWWWFSPAEPPDLRAYVIEISISPADPEVLLAGVEFGAVVRSEDGGATWSRHRPGALRDCHSLKFHHQDSMWAYQAGHGGLSLSREGGQRWEKRSQGLAARYGIVCAADPMQREIWYGCVGTGPMNAFGDDPEVYLYRSEDNGWKPIGWQEHPLTETPTALVTLPGAAGELYAGLQRGSVLHSTDYGESWSRLPLNLGGIWHHMIVLAQ